MKKFISLLVVGVLSFTLFSGCSNKGTEETKNTSSTQEASTEETTTDEVFEMSVGIGYNDKSTEYKTLEYYKKMIEEKSNGRLKLNIYHSSALGNDKEVMESLQMGTLEMCVTSSAPVVPFINDFKVFDLPFLFPSYESADAVLDSEVAKELLDKLSDVGLIGAAFWENGYRNLTNSKKEVKTPEDVKGLKIRTMENPIHLATWELLGANPTPMAYGELFSAMQQKVVDGQENPWETIYTQNFYEVQDYVTNTGHVYSPFVVMFSAKWWEKLPSDLQTILLESTEESKEYNRKICREAADESIAALKDKMTVTLLSTEEIGEFQKAVQPIYEQFSDDIGKDLIESVQKIVTESLK